jgi:GT2 family glycosyltransferase
VRQEIFERMAGYHEIPLMDDMDFSRRLKRYGKIVILPQRINTSARRWLEDGYILNSIRSWAFQSAWALGASPHLLAKWYRFK